MGAPLTLADARTLAEGAGLAPSREYDKAVLQILLAIERRLARLEALAEARLTKAQRARLEGE